MEFTLLHCILIMFALLFFFSSTFYSGILSCFTFFPFAFIFFRLHDNDKAYSMSLIMLSVCVCVCMYVLNIR